MWRTGTDYESGDGTRIPGDFESWEGRGKVGYRDGRRLVAEPVGGLSGAGPYRLPGAAPDRRLLRDGESGLNLAPESK